MRRDDGQSPALYLIGFCVSVGAYSQSCIHPPLLAPVMMNTLPGRSHLGKGGKVLN